MSADIATALRQLDASSPLYATQFVELLLAAAGAAGASDVHVQPTAACLSLRWRLDGVLAPLGDFPRGMASDVVSRLKVLAELLTYRSDVPQEGRIRQQGIAQVRIEMRVSTFPTLHGERAVVRLFAGENRFSHLADLDLPEEIEKSLSRLLAETSGAVLLTGPAGSGKTTTAYACLRDVVRASSGRRGVVTLEDPIEVAIDGVSQSQVQPAAGFTLATGLRSLMRQDPEVILVGEIRDRETVETVFQAALTGHLVISTFHAGSAAGAIGRLLDMGMEPYLLTSGLRAVVHQRLLRRLCSCGEAVRDRADFLGLPVSGAKKAAGCALCRHSGYSGRLAVAEMLPPFSGELSQAILAKSDIATLAQIARRAGMKTVLERACQAVEGGHTDPAEVRRVLGFVDETSAAD
jgi:type II secretory ATPase GspE/PulE/Tfp pilus assembly ATPase PilB-like protein